MRHIVFQVAGQPLSLMLHVGSLGKHHSRSIKWEFSQPITAQRAAVLLGVKSHERSPRRNSNPCMLACRELEALAKDGKFGCYASFNNQDGTDGLHTKTCNGEAVEELPNKVAKTAKQPNAAGLRHVATEQRRRDRINEGCVTAPVPSLLCASLFHTIARMLDRSKKSPLYT